MSVCGFLSDVEGNWDFFLKYVEISKVLSWSDGSKTQLVLKDDCRFVFGGDAVDKGTGDIRYEPCISGTFDSFGSGNMHLPCIGRLFPSPQRCWKA
jgi:hypothetical protein